MSKDDLPLVDDMKLFSAKEVNTLLVPRIDEIDQTIQQLKEDLPGMVVDALEKIRQNEILDNKLMWEQRITKIKAKIPFGVISGLVGIIAKLYFGD